MPLFQPKVLQKHLQLAKPIPKEHLQAIQDWQNEIRGKLKSLGEVSGHNLFIKIILERLLGYTSEGENYTAYHECPIPGEKGFIDVGLGKFTPQSKQIIVPLELKGLDTKNLDAVMPGRKKTPVEQVWEYVNKLIKPKWALLSNYQELRLYAVGYGRQAYETWQLDQLDQPEEYNRFYTLLCADNLLGGQTENLLLENDKVEKDITDRLYSDYRNLRLSLIKELRLSYPDLAVTDLLQYAQTIIDRILFISFAEDKGLLPNHILEQAYEQQNPFNPLPAWENFKGLFRSIDKGNSLLKIPAYNGGLFAPHNELDTLVLSDSLCERFRDISRYDFASEVSVNVLGHIFEQSIADLEKLQAQLASGEEIEEKTTKARATTGKRKQDGVVYTPNHITRFIIEHTLGSYINAESSRLILDFQKKSKDGSLVWRSKKSELEFWYAWQNRLKTIRIIDPACGSGAFLVAAFDYLLLEYKKINDTLENLTGSYDVFDLNKTILNNNLYGVDLNPESVEITRLSLWLKTAERGKPLENLDRTIRCGNSLIADPSLSSQAFSWQDQFPDVFSDGGFDVVLGNPPYVRMELLKPIKPYLEKNYFVASDRADLYAYFFELGLKILKSQGKLGYISSSTFFRTGSGENLRHYLLKNAKIEVIVDFGDVQIFEGVTTYPAILIMEKSNTADEIRFCKITEKLGGELTQQFSESNKTISQSHLGSDSWQFDINILSTLRKKINHGKKPLRDIYASPLYGIKTGLNDAFVINNSTRDKLISEHKKSEDIIKPFLEGKDIKRWHVESRKLWIIYIPKNKIAIDNYPAIKTHLLPFKEMLEKRATKQEWFELQQAQLAYQPMFDGLKITYGHFAKTTIFSLEKKNFYSNDKTYIIPVPNTEEGNFLLGLLNSNLMWWLLKGLAPAVRGGFLELRNIYVETLPIPEASAEEKQRIGTMAEGCQGLAERRYSVEQKMCRRILTDFSPAGEEGKLSQKLQAWWELDFKAFHAEIKKCLKVEIPLKDRDDWQELFEARQAEVKTLSTQLATKEAELNQTVYALFKLSAEEITLLESSLGH